MKDFAGKIAFITGGASGAGFGQAQLFSEAGMKVVIADVRDDHLAEAAAYFKEKNADVHAIKLDVTDREGFAKAADEVERIYGGPPELLILTAGVNVFGPAEASTYEDFDWVVGVCFGGVLNGLITFVPRMIKAGKGGHITATVSWGAFGAEATTAPYRAAKAGALNLLESYYLALKPYNIEVSALCPASINSRIHESALLARPDHLKNTGYHVTEETQEYVATTQVNGLEPYELAQRHKKGIESGQFLIIPYPNGTRMVELEIERFVHYTTAEGTRRMDERREQPPNDEERRLMFERSGSNVTPSEKTLSSPNTGFAKAKKGIDWVDASRKV